MTAPQHFRTGPMMIKPWLAIILVAGCVILAATQAWPLLRHFSGAAALDPGEPAARVAFSAIFLLIGAGIAIALLERRRAGVTLDDDGLTLQRWWGAERRLQREQVEAVVLLRPRSTAREGDLPFHRLSVRLRGGGCVRLAGGPWPLTDEVDLLRRRLCGRLGFRREQSAGARWLLIFRAERVTWT